ncbi:hypothetical protein [Streptomyces sp. NPDC057552]|uniref:hypothetical protein n=1 Tax=Streptomyces sp. NPDC057552 TaxID=3350537 RepID=UPI00368EE19B
MRTDLALLKLAKAVLVNDEDNQVEPMPILEKGNVVTDMNNNVDKVMMPIFPPRRDGR